MASKMPLFVGLSLVTLSYFIHPLLAEPDNYIVHMDLSAMPKAFSTQHSWYLAALSSVTGGRSKTSTGGAVSSLSYSKLIYSYSHAMNGFSASLTPDELEALKAHPGYIYSMIDLPVKPDTTRSSQFLGLNDRFGAWPISRYGEDVIIGVVDTGVWPESESFNDDGMTDVPSRWKGACESGTQFNSTLCSKKLIGARFFNKGLVARFPNITISMNSTRDTDGHGTHTSSTAGGNFVKGATYFGYATGTASGVAPRARVAVYKALWEEGAYSSDIIAAIEQALIDGVDVLSLSLGLDGVPLYADPVAIATFGAVEKGIFVSASAGNEGPFYGTLHNGTPWLLTVAAGYMDREFGAVLTLGNGVPIEGSSLYPGNSSASQLPIVFMDTCNSLNELDKVREKIIVCEDKNESLSDQFDNARDAKVVGGIFITNITDIEFYLQTSFPAIIVNPEKGETIKDYIKSSAQAKASMEFQKTHLGTKPAPTVASYSSRGPSQSCPVVLKPDIMAPGALVIAAWPSKSLVAQVDSQPLYSNFNILSGTSMSCPHAAGMAALLKEAHPGWSPAAIRSAMMTTSYLKDNSDSPIKEVGDNYKAATPLAMGAGHVDPNKALDPGLIYDANSNDYLNLLCALNYTENQIKVITKLAAINCSTPSLDFNYPSFIAYFNSKNQKSEAIIKREFQRTVTNVGGGMSTYTANLTPMKGFKVSVTPDKLVFKEENEKQMYKLSIEGPNPMKEQVEFGYLSWEDGKHVVRSPIVATSLDSESLN